MKIDSKLLIQALKKAGEDRGMTQEELGKQLGFSKDRAKNIFTGRTKLSGDDVLRILSDPQYSLPKLKKYMPYWRLRSNLADVERESRIMDAFNENALMYPERIQSSPMQTNIRKPLSEMARDVMSGKRWWVLRTGWICSAEIQREVVAFKPIAPDFLTAAKAMKRMGWIDYNKDMHTACAYWGKINGGKTEPESNVYCEETLRNYIMNPNNGFDLDSQFRQVITGKSIGAIEIDKTKELLKFINIVSDVAANWSNYSLSTQTDVYGFSPADLYRDKFDYLELAVLGMCAAHYDLVESDIEIDESVERRYLQIMSEDGKRYRYSALIDPILAVNDRAGHLAKPTVDDWRRYNALRRSR